jgi:hypothetical protein
VSPWSATAPDEVDQHVRLHYVQSTERRKNVKKIVFLMFAVIALLTLALGCATIDSRPSNPALRANLKFIEHYVKIETNERGETTDRTICVLRAQNIGSEAIGRTRFRLTLRNKHNGQLVYSRVHSLDLNLGPRDIVTKEFNLQEFVYNSPYDYLLDEVEVW